MRTGNDHDELRKDPVFATLAGKLAPVLRSDCEALAGKSTLNRVEHTPKRHSEKYKKIDCDQAQVDTLLVDVFLEAHERAPCEIVLDLDNTDIPLYEACRRAASITAIMTNIAICRSTCSAADTCFWPGRGVRTSAAAMAAGRIGGADHCADPAKRGRACA